MEQKGYITEEENPSEWVSSMFVSMRILICLNPFDLNKVVKKAHHPIKTVEDIVSNIPNTRVLGTDSYVFHLALNRLRKSSNISWIKCMKG